MENQKQELRKEVKQALSTLKNLVSYYELKLNSEDVDPGRLFYAIRKATESLLDSAWVFGNISDSGVRSIKAHLEIVQKMTDESAKQVWKDALEKMRKDPRYKDCPWLA